MRLQDVVLDIDKLPVNYDNSGNRPFIVIWCEGKARMTYLPDHGETKVVTYQGVVKRVKFDEGENF